MKLAAGKLFAILSAFVFIIIGLFYVVHRDTVSPSINEEHESNVCENFHDKLVDRIIQGTQNVSEGETKIITLANSLHADMSVLCPHYLPSSKELKEHLINLGVARKAASEIAYQDRWVEGYYLYFVKNDSVICESHSFGVDAQVHEPQVAKLGNEIHITVQVDPNTKSLSIKNVE